MKGEPFFVPNKMQVIFVHYNPIYNEFTKKKRSFKRFKRLSR
jgi:hypothetical protein